MAGNARDFWVLKTVNLDLVTEPVILELTNFAIAAATCGEDEGGKKNGYNTIKLHHWVPDSADPSNASPRIWLPPHGLSVGPIS